MDNQYAYMVEYNGITVCIMYHLGRYCVAKMCKKNDKVLTDILRQYKTLGGAERYLLKDIPRPMRTAPNIKYGTMAYIKKGEYWK